MLLLLAIVFTLAAAASAACDRHYFEIGGGCFRVYTLTRTFSGAELVCSADGAHLASIHNAYEEQGLRELLHPTPALIGLECVEGTCTWTDGTPYDYQSFHGGTPWPADGDCAAMSKADGIWTSTSCSTQHSSFVCKMKAKTPLDCGDYSSYDGFCLQAKLSPLSALAAEDDCAAEGGHLVSIDGESDNTYYRNVLISYGVNSTAHIGLRNNGGNYQWTDGSSSDYTNWAQYFPNSRFGDCVQMTLTSEVGSPGQWINENCAVPYPYICKREAGAQPTRVPTPTMAPSSCPNMQLFEDAGTIYSPGYPISFPPRARC